MSGRGSVPPRSAQPAADELVRLPEPHREDTSKLEEQRPGERRIAARERLVAFVVESADLAVRDRTHGRRARAGVEESDLADDRAGGHRYDARARRVPFHRDNLERARDDDADRSSHFTPADEAAFGRRLGGISTEVRSRDVDLWFAARTLDELEGRALLWFARGRGVGRADHVALRVGSEETAHGRSLLRGHPL